MKTRSTQSANWVLAPLDRFAPACPVLCLWKPPQKINNICIERFHSYLGGLVNSLWHSKATLTSALQWLSFRKTSSLFSNKQKTETSSRFSNLDKQTNDKRRGYAATHQEISRRNGPWIQATKYYKSIYYIGSASIEFSAKTCHRADLEEAFTLFDRMGDGQIDAQVKKQTNFQLDVSFNYGSFQVMTFWQTNKQTLKLLSLIPPFRVVTWQLSDRSWVICWGLWARTQNEKRWKQSAKRLPRWWWWYRVSSLLPDR